MSVKNKVLDREAVSAREERILNGYVYFACQSLTKIRFGPKYSPMGLIAEFTVETPILQEALGAVPDMVAQIETIHVMPDQPSKGLIWVWGDDFQTFEQNLGSDPTVNGFKLVTETEEQRLYRITYTEEGEESITYSVLAEHDGSFLNTTGTHKGLEIRARFPDRDALAAYREACRERDVPFYLHTLYREERTAGDGRRNDPYGVTNPQREALVHALEMGYFAIPRQTTLEEVADELGISTQAVSQRLRRGQENMLRATLA